MLSDASNIIVKRTLLLIFVVLFGVNIVACKKDDDNKDNRETKNEEVVPLEYNQTANGLYPFLNKTRDYQQNITSHQKQIVSQINISTNISNISTVNPIVIKPSFQKANRAELSLDRNDIIIDLTFADNIVPKDIKTCQALVLKRPLNQAFRSQLYTEQDELNITTPTTLSSLQINDSFLDSAVIYKNSSEVIMQDEDDNSSVFLLLNQSNFAENLDYKSIMNIADRIGLGNTDRYSYRAVVLCGNDSYSDYSNTKNFTVKTGYTRTSTSNSTTIPIEPIAIHLINPLKLSQDKLTIITSPEIRDISYCKAVITVINATNKASHISNSSQYANELYQTSHQDVSALTIGSKFFDGEVVSITSMSELTKPDGTKYLQTGIINLPMTLDLVNKTYYPVVECNGTIYSDYSNNSQELSVLIPVTDRAHIKEPINKDILKPVTLNMVQPLKLPINKLTMSVTPMPRDIKACTALTLEIPKVSEAAYSSNIANYADIFNQTGAGVIEALSVNDTFLNARVSSIGKVFEYIAANGTKYLQTDISSLPKQLNLTSYVYYEALECGGVLYSDYSNASSSVSVNISSVGRYQGIFPNFSRDILDIVHLNMVEPVKRSITKAMPAISPSMLIIGVTFPAGKVPINSCKVLIVQTQKVGYTTARQATNFYTTTSQQFAQNLHVSSSYLAGTIVFISNVSIYDDTSGQKYIQINKTDLTSFDLSRYNYYPALTCIDANSDGIYSDYTNTQSFAMSGGSNIDKISISFNTQQRRTTIQAQSNPSSALFTVNLTFSNVPVPSKSCEYIILSTNVNSTYNRQAVAPILYSSSLTMLKTLQQGASFMNATIAYINANETLYQTSLGQIYMSANIANADINTKDYYPLAVCDTVYSDFLNVTKFVSTDRLNIDTLNISLIQPMVSVQPADDIVFGTNAQNASTMIDAFNQNGSQYNFILDLGNMPDPQNATCQYATSIDYESALKAGQTLILPQNESDFESLYPGMQFGNSEAHGVIAIVKNPIMHHITSNTNIGTGTGYYLGIRSATAKPVQNYINVALCKLADKVYYVGVANSSNTTSYNKDTTQELRFNVTFDSIPQSAIYEKDVALAMTNASSSVRIQLIPDGVNIEEIKRAIQNNTCGTGNNGPQVLVGIDSANESLFRGLNYNISTYRNASTATWYQRRGGILYYFVRSTFQSLNNFTVLTDYRDIFVTAPKIEESTANWLNRSTSQFSNYAANWGLDNSNVDVFVILGCDLGGGHGFKTDLTTLTVGHFVTNSTNQRIEFLPRPYKIHIIPN